MTEHLPSKFRAVGWISTIGVEGNPKPGWKDGLVVSSIRCSSRVRFGSQRPHVSPGLVDPAPSSGLAGHCTQWYLDIPTGKHHTPKNKVNLKKKKKQNQSEPDVMAHTGRKMQVRGQP